VSKPRYALIADDIRAKISRGEYAPGDQLPTKAQLMDDWHAALNTVAKAIDVLRAEGIVETYHGVGSFVQAPPPAAEDDESCSDDSELSQLRARVEELESCLSRVEQLEANLMNVYSNLGLEYPSTAESAPVGRAKEAM
jgi:DNA-binding GntR family transcriptional regulator